MMIVKIIEIIIKTTKDVISPSGGCCGRDKKSISGHEDSRIAKCNVMGILCANAVTS
jgi:hypothetical protein